MSNTPSSLLRLWNHARALIGLDVGHIADELGLPIPVGHVRTKGWAGKILEQELGAATAGAGVDFAELGVELKTVPVDSAGVPRESTAVCHIDPATIIHETWPSSYARRKLACVLFVAMQVPRTPHSVGERRITEVKLWRPTLDDDLLLSRDFDFFVNEYFRPGRIDGITGHMGAALQVRPKGRNAADRIIVRTPDGGEMSVGRCGFYLRPRFVAQLLRRPCEAEFS